MVRYCTLVVLLLTIGFSTVAYSSSYRNIPGVTAEEIKAIEALKSKGHSFSLGKLLSTEEFLLPDGSYAGFSPKLSEFLSNLFEIPFTLEFHNLGSLMKGLENKTIDFTCELTITPERQKIFIMSNPILQRSLAIVTYGDHKIEATRDLNGLRVGILERSSVWEFIASSYPELKFETIPIPNSAYEADMLKNGEIDAIISISTVLTYDYIGTEFTLIYDMLPLAYTPAALSTANPELAPIISVMNKYLATGGLDKLFELYKSGETEYKRNTIKQILSDEERAYLESLDAKVPIVLGTDTYPVSFYNENGGEFQGIAIDVLMEISRITGIEFDIINKKDASWGEILEMLKTGKAALISDLIVTEERKEHFIWPKIPYFSTPYVFISKAEFPSLELYRIGQKTVAIVDWCATHQLYKQWFPNNSNIKLYNSQDEALDALEKGEADLFFNLGYILYYQKNYREKPNYKANYTFPVLNDIFFGLNKNEKILSSIIDKSILYIDIDKISYDWMSRSYDYSKVLAQTRVTYLTVFAAVLLVVLLVIAILMVIIINKGKLIAKQSQRLEQTLVRANAANKAKSELLTTISHEIRTPMNAILGITEIQLQNETLSQNTKESLGIIYNSGDSLLRIINDLLDLSKIEAKKLEIIPIEYDIASLISDTTLLNMMRIESKPIEFKLNVDENIPAILFGDELRIKQVLNNVLSNAFKYTDSGEVSMSVSAEENFEVTLVFRISDTGYGMTKEQIRKIFDEYSRFNLIDSNKIEGTGLGMNITQGLVSLMEGSISVESEPGKGSVFTIRLPQKKVGTDVLGKELVENLQKFSVSNISEIEKIKIVREPMPYGKVLVVDDVESNLYVAKNLLESYDLSVDLATNGFEAIEKIESGKVYDIVLMDHMMPKMDGIETTKKIREQGYKHPIIALTANAIVGQAEMFLENGFDGFISKPIDTALLNSELNRFIRDKKSPKVLSKSHKSDTVLFSTFVRDAKKVLPFFELTLKNIDSISDDDLHLFSIKAHGIKSALSNIYKTEVSKLAAILEMAGKKHDKNAIKAQTQGLIDALHSIVSEIEAREKETVADRDENTDYLHEQLRIISKACENYNIKAANAALDNLKEMSWTHETKAFLEKIEEHLLQSDFEEVEAEIRCSYAHLLQKGKQTTQ